MASHDATSTYPWNPPLSLMTKCAVIHIKWASKEEAGHFQRMKKINIAKQLLNSLRWSEPWRPSPFPLCKPHIPSSEYTVKLSLLLPRKPVGTFQVNSSLYLRPKWTFDPFTSLQTSDHLPYTGISVPVPQRTDGWGGRLFQRDNMQVWRPCGWGKGKESIS